MQPLAPVRLNHTRYKHRSRAGIIPSGCFTLFPSTPYFSKTPSPTIAFSRTFT